MILLLDHQHAGPIFSMLSITVVGYRKPEHLYGLVEHHVAKAILNVMSLFADW